MWRGMAGLVVLICAACMSAPGSALAGTLDQHQTDALGTHPDIDANQSLAQTFTAALTGKLDEVDLYLGQVVSSQPLKVEIRDVSGTVPGSTVLASQSVAASDVPPDLAAAFVPINFAAPASVSAGSQYAVVAYSAAAAGNGYRWAQSGAVNPYLQGAGSFALSSPPTTTWNPLLPDLAFKTYVAPVATPPTTPPPASGPTGERAAALKKCKKRHSARARRKCRRRATLLPL